MSGLGKHAGEPGGERSDPYGFGPGAGISVGGYFPRTTLLGTQERARGTEAVVSRPSYAVGLVVPSWILHAVPWDAAVPGVATTAMCAAKARVAAISRLPVIWTPLDPMACQDCAVAVAATREARP
ncbi:hypothetical protein AB0M95_10285 [Sphaerisporangium sp. NPDC051017]|uniref:hypothetical protein n=1 Tax=Sphaerisporangium sp. NPDC051017 TaxID=3154636 RepID=UPI00343FA9B0